MRLNRVESFYIFLLYFCSKRSGEGAAGQATYKGGWPQPYPLQGWPATHGQAGCRGSRLRYDPRLDAAWASSQGLGDARGGVTLGSGANRRGGRPLAGRLPTGKGSCLLRRGDDDDDIMRVRKEG
ncbi:hypothetical protein GW17_00007433 [Ensete ventricosum]|nr:hypothetical protein GW17_00007433 [Ensete ventricosum]